MEKIPKDVLFTVFCFFSYKEIVHTLSLVCKKWREVCRMEQMWKELCFQEGVDCPNLTWEEEFKAFKVEYYFVIELSEQSICNNNRS